MMFIKSAPDQIKMYLNQHKVETKKSIEVYDNLKSTVIGSYFKMTYYNGDAYFIGKVVKNFTFDIIT